MFDHDEREEASMEFDSIIDDMLADQQIGGSLVAQAFVD